MNKIDCTQVVNLYNGDLLLVFGTDESDVLFVELPDLNYVCSFGDFEVKIQKWELKGFKGDLLDFVVEECGL